MENAQLDDGVLNMVRNWFKDKTGKVNDRNINENKIKTLHADVPQLYNNLDFNDFKQWTWDTVNN